MKRLANLISDIRTAALAAASSFMRKRKIYGVTALCATLCGLPSSVVFGKEQVAQNTIHDLRYGEALYYFYQEKYFSAITRLMRAQKYQPITKQGDDPSILLGSLFLTYGLDKEAATLFNTLLQENKAPASQDKIWYYLGKLRYQRGYLQQAAEALNYISDTLPPEHNSERLNMLANIHLKQNDYARAASVLEKYKDKSIWKQYTQYNLGVVYINNGEHRKGVKLLEKVADIRATDAETRALKDKANLALGFAYIHEQQAKDAIDYFKEIRLSGPLSNKALLGLGWAYSMLNQYERALVPWQELEKRHVIDPTVQESMLAVSYAMEKADAPQLAMNQYQRAVQIYLDEKNKLDTVINAVKRGELIKSLQPNSRDLEISSPSQLKAVPHSISLPYLNEVLAGRAFQEAYKNYRDLLYLRNVLNHWQRQLPVFRTMLKERKSAYQDKLNRIAKDQRLYKFDQLKLKRDRLAKEIKQIRQQHNVLALANNKERNQLDVLHSIKNTLQQVAGNGDLREQQEKARLYYGLLYWKISTDYAPRLWEASKTLQQLDAALAKAKHAQKALAQAKQQAPDGFRGYSRRIQVKAAQLKSLRQRLDSLIKSQQVYLQTLAVTELQTRQHQLNDYHLRAQFTLSLLLDKLANNPQSNGVRP